MKKLYYVFPLFVYTAFVLVPIASARAQTGARKSITDIPLKAHTRAVDLFFENEKPKEPFYKVMIIEQRGAPDASMESMLLALEKTAREQGIDGILLGDPGKQTGSVITYANNGGFISYQRLAGTGIRYRRTIDYMDTIVKEQSVSLWTDDNTEPKLFTMKYDFYGNNLSLGDPFIFRFFDGQIFPYEDGSSAFAVYAGWENKYDPEEQVFSRKKVIVDYTYSVTRFYYDAGKLTKAEIVVTPEGALKKDRWQLQPIYNNSGLLIGRRLMDGKKPAWEEVITYRLNGMPDKIQRFKIVNGQRVPSFEIKNTYYSESDLPAPEK